MLKHSVIKVFNNAQGEAQQQNVIYDSNTNHFNIIVKLRILSKSLNSYTYSSFFLISPEQVLLSPFNWYPARHAQKKLPGVFTHVCWHPWSVILHSLESMTLRNKKSVMNYRMVE